MPKLTYTNERGQSIVLGDSPPLLVTAIDGLGSPQNEIQRQRGPYQDGFTVVGSSLAERELVIEGVILDRDIDRYRRQLVQTFNPKLSGVLRYERGLVAREIKVVPEIAPVFPSDYSVRHQVFMLTLLAPNPFWLDTYFESREMSYLMGGIQFRLKLPTVFSYRGFKRRAINGGDVSTPVEIEFKGPAVNPTVINETIGEFITVNRELQEDDVLSISTTFGEKYVRVNGENAFHYFDLGSVFWQLKPGDNILSYTSNNDSINTKVIVRWKNRYVGL